MGAQAKGAVVEEIVAVAGNHVPGAGYIDHLRVRNELVVVSALSGLAALTVLGRGAPRAGRYLAAAAVAAVVGGWGVAQYPFILGTHLTLGADAAPDSTLTAVAVVFVAAAITCVPSLVYLYVLGQRGQLDSH